MSVESVTYEAGPGRAIVVMYPQWRSPEATMVADMAHDPDVPGMLRVVSDVMRAGRFAWASSRMGGNSAITAARAAAREAVEKVLASEGYHPARDGD